MHSEVGQRGIAQKRLHQHLRTIHLNYRFWLCGADHFSPATLLIVPSEKLRCTCCICIWYLNFSCEWSMTQFWMERWRRRAELRAHLMDAPFELQILFNIQMEWNMSDNKLDVTYLDVFAQNAEIQWLKFTFSRQLLSPVQSFLWFSQKLYSINPSVSYTHTITVNATMLATSAVGISYFLRSASHQKTRWHLVRSHWMWNSFALQCTNSFILLGSQLLMQQLTN